LWLLWTKGPWPLTNGWFALFSGLAALSGNRLALEKIRGNHGLGYCATCHCCSLFRRGQNCLSSRNLISASANLPEAFVLIVEMQSAISRIVALAAVGAGNETADVHSLPIEIFGNCKGRATTAGDQEHAEVQLGRVALGFSSLHI
jgi:hypothetical protein